MAEGLTRRLIGLAISSRQNKTPYTRDEKECDNDHEDESKQQHHRHHHHNKRPFHMCGMRTECLSATAARVCRGRPVVQRMMRCDNYELDQYRKGCIRSMGNCWSTVSGRVLRYVGQNDDESRFCPLTFWETMDVLSQRVIFLWTTENSAMDDDSRMRSPLSIQATDLPYNREIPHSQHMHGTKMSSPFLDLEAATESTKTTSLDFSDNKTVASQRQGRKVSTATGDTGELSEQQFGAVHNQTLEEDLESGTISVSPPPETTKISSIANSPNVLTDYTTCRVDNLLAKPDLEVVFQTQSYSFDEENGNVNFDYSGFKLLGESTDEAKVYFNLRFPDAESMKQRNIDQMERAERTSDFLETAKSLTLQLSSRRGSSMSTSSYASSMGNSYDTSIVLSTPTDSDRGRRQQRRSSFLAGSKIDRFETSRSSSGQDDWRYKRHCSRRSLSDDTFSHEHNHHSRRNSIPPKEQPHLSEEEKQQQQDMERMRMVLGYEDMEVPTNCNSEENSVMRLQHQHGHLGTVEVTEQLKRSRRQHKTSRRSSFVAGSKIELYEDGRKSRRQSSHRASM